MRTLALLFALLGLPLPVAHAQEADAPEGAIIDAVEVSGFSLYDLSPGLQKDINSLVGAPLSRERLERAGLAHRGRAARDRRGGSQRLAT